MLVSHTFPSLIPPVKHLGSLTPHTLSVGATFFPFTPSAEPAIGSAHQCSGMRRGIGGHSTQTGNFSHPMRTLSLTYHPCRFVNRDAFARFAGIGIGCQRLQASNVLEISIGPDPPDPPPPDAPFEDGVDDIRFKDCYVIEPDNI